MPFSSYDTQPFFLFNFMIFSDIKHCKDLNLDVGSKDVYCYYTLCWSSLLCYIVLHKRFKKEGCRYWLPWWNLKSKYIYIYLRLITNSLELRLSFVNKLKNSNKTYKFNHDH
jgi:hypothetical protein